MTVLRLSWRTLQPHLDNQDSRRESRAWADTG